MLRTLLHRPIAVTMTLIAIVTLGVLAFDRIPVSLMPDIDVPRIVVQMAAQGSSAREIEQRMVKPMRQQLSQVTGLQNIESTSRTDAGTVTLSFSPGTDMSMSFIEVNEKIDRAMSSMPKDMERPKVMKIGALDIPAFYIDVTGGKTEQTSRLVRNVISKRLEQVPEVAMVDYSGMVGTQIAIIPDPMRIAGLGISNSEIEKAVSDNNVVLEALSVRDGIYRYTIHFDSQILSVSDIENIYIRHEGRLLQIKDICKVEEMPADRKGIVTSDGKPAITMAVIKQSDAQMSTLQGRIDTLMTQIEKDYPELQLHITRDQTRLLSYSMDNLQWNLILGIIMASVVLFFFIGGWRMPLLVIISIPLSLVLTLLCFYVIGVSLNIISLSGLILGVGMIVDNAIIVMDNIRQKKACDDRTIVQSVKEVFMPMLSSVLTTCSVFVPLIFLSGTAGALFFDQAMGITIALLCSLAVASIVVPVYFRLLYRRKEFGSRAKENRMIMRWYEKGIRFTFRNGRKMILAFAGCIVMILAVSPMIRKERMPVLPHDDAIVTIDWNAGITPEENDRRVKEVLKAAGKYMTSFTTMVGGQDFILSHTRNITSSEAVCYIKSATAADCQKARETMMDYVAKHYPKAKTEAELATNIFDMIFSTDEPDLQIRLQNRSGGRPAVEQTRTVTDSLRLHFPELNIQHLATETYLQYQTDAQQMAYYKVTYQQLYLRFRELLGSNNIYDINSGGESVPVIIGTDGRDADVLLGNTIRNADGIDIPLEYLVEESRKEDYKHLTAGDEGEYAAIDIETAGDGEVRKVMDYVSRITDDDARNLQATFTGNYFSSRTMVWELAMVMLVAVMLLYFILAAQFESLLQPVIILAEVVIDVALVMLALFVCGETLNVMSMIGMVVMCGIIINDSILKVDTINRLYRQAVAANGVTRVTLLRSIVTAGHQRLRPIIMTSLTTILAILPLLQRGDMGSALQFPLSFTIIVGMTVGTMVSLFFVPLVYHAIYGRRWFGGK
ncbi:MAG: efflux RND transporter permease subunit [Prevotella sp.]|nr:efflux RND transporter permease subunit [Prevotella sp.]